MDRRLLSDLESYAARVQHAARLRDLVRELRQLAPDSSALRFFPLTPPPERRERKAGER